MPQPPSTLFWHSRSSPPSEAEIQRSHQSGFELWHAPLARMVTEPLLSVLLSEEIACHDNPSFILTSANGLLALPSQLPTPMPPIWVVGSASAQAAWNAGFKECFYPPTPKGAQALIDHMCRTAPKDRHYIYLRGANIHTDICGQLLQQGFSCSEIVTYRMEWLDVRDKITQRWPILQGTFIYSEQAATHLIAQLNKAELDWHAHPFFCLSDACASPLHAAGAVNVHVSHATHSGSLLECAKRFITSQS